MRSKTFFMKIYFSVKIFSKSQSYELYDKNNYLAVYWLAENGVINELWRKAVVTSHLGWCNMGCSLNSDLSSLDRVHSLLRKAEWLFCANVNSIKNREDLSLIIFWLSQENYSYFRRGWGIVDFCNTYFWKERFHHISFHITLTLFFQNSIFIRSPKIVGVIQQLVGVYLWVKVYH